MADEAVAVVAAAAARDIRAWSMGRRQRKQLSARHLLDSLSKRDFREMNKRPIIPYHKLPKRLSVLPKEEAISDTVSTRDYSDLFVYFRFAIIPFYVTTFVSIIIFYY